MKKVNDLERLTGLFGDLMVPHQTMQTGGIMSPPASNSYGEDFDIVALMAEARDPDTGLLRDLRIDDRDLPQASSFYDYAFNIIGDDAHPPWIVQGWIGLMLFGEVCPVCSDKRWLDPFWFIDNVDKTMPFKDIKQGLKILKHGKCPKCKREKWDLIKNHGLHNYTELVNVLGQRSGKSASCAFYSSYHTHRYLKFPRLADHTKAMQKSTELTGTFVSLTFAKAFGLLWTPFVNIIDESKWFCLAEGSKVTLASGEQQPIEKLTPGTSVKTFESSQPVKRLMVNGVKACLEMQLADGKKLIGTPEHKVQCLGPDGESLIWKCMADLTLSDYVVTI